MQQKLIYEGKAKQLFQSKQQNVLRVVYKDDATMLNGAKKAVFTGKGKLNNQITAIIFKYLQKKHINSHFIKQISDNEQLIQAVEMIPLEVVVRNVLAGSLAKRLGKEEGETLPSPIVEFYYKDDQLDDPFVNGDHICYLKVATREEIIELKQVALNINQALQELFQKCQIILVDFKLEFGKTKTGTIMLADEISPDTCRLWDEQTAEKLDKDVYRRNIGNLITVYDEVLKRLKEAD